MISFLQIVVTNSVHFSHLSHLCVFVCFRLEAGCQSDGAIVIMCTIICAYVRVYVCVWWGWN
jgi:hypothetical protein